MSWTAVNKILTASRWVNSIKLSSDQIWLTYVSFVKILNILGLVPKISPTKFFFSFVDSTIWNCLKQERDSYIWCTRSIWNEWLHFGLLPSFSIPGAISYLNSFGNEQIIDHLCMSPLSKTQQIKHGKFFNIPSICINISLPNWCSIRLHNFEQKNWK